MEDDVAEEMLSGESRFIREDDPLLDRARSLVTEDFGGETEPAGHVPPPPMHQEHKASSDGIVWATGHGSGVKDKQ